MVMEGVRLASLDAIPPVEGHDLNVDAAWKPVRHHLGVDVFGLNAYVASAPGQVVIEKHKEEDTGHHELYFVHTGRARFTLGDQSFEAGPGTFVYVEDPALVRKAVAEEPGTAIVAVGAQPGAAFEPSEWELSRTAGIDQAS